MGIGEIFKSPELTSRFLKPAMLFTFFAILLFFGIMSIVLNYHWAKYGINTKRLAQVRRIYFGVSAILLLAIASFMIGTIR